MGVYEQAFLSSIRVRYFRLLVKSPGDHPPSLKRDSNEWVVQGEVTTWVFRHKMRLVAVAF